ncbi:unnamed protein product [Parajaminaea phylloscopi]
MEVQTSFPNGQGAPVPAEDSVEGAVPGVAVVSSSSTSSADLRLHPLAILNISEHIVRSTVQEQSQQSHSIERGVSSVAANKVYGALLGTQNGRHVEIHNTFEIKVDSNGALDHSFFKSRQAQLKQTFPTFDVLGWYSNGVQPTQSDVVVHRQLLDYNESPLFLQLSPNPSELGRKGGELPIELYESQMELKADKVDRDQAESSSGRGGASPSPAQAGLVFVKCAKYRIETGEAERIAVDYASKPSGSSVQVSASGGPVVSGHHSAVISSLESQQSGIRMLQSRIQLAHRYVAGFCEDAGTSTSSGNGQSAAYASSDVASTSTRTVPKPTGQDHDILRRLKAILATVQGQSSRNGSTGMGEAPSDLSKTALSHYQREGEGDDDDDDDDFNSHFLREYNDALLTANLSGMTQSLHRLNELVDKFDLVHSGYNAAGLGSAAGLERSSR